MARKKCWKCKWAAQGGKAGTECNYLATHERSRTIQAYEACGVKHPTPETDRMLSGETCAFFEPGARVYRKMVSVVLPGSNPKALCKERKKKQTVYDWSLGRTLHGQGLHDAEIGAALGCSATTVYKWRRREGLPAIKRRTEPVYDWNKARELFAAGAGSAEIAKALGGSESAVKVWKQREGLQKPKPNWAKAIRMHKDGVNARTIAAAIGVKERTVKEWARRNGLQW